MNGKYIIILLFIFLVFLINSINSTVTNNFYNNTTGSQDHAVLSNLSYADSNHTGFQSSDTLDSDVSALGYVTDEYHDEEKLNITGGTMFGDFNNNTAGDIYFDRQSMNFTAGTPAKLLDNNTGITGSINFMDMAIWNSNLMSFSNGVYFNTSCGTDDGVGGYLGYCWQRGKNQTPARAGMAFQFVNEAFSYFIWDANINISKMNTQNQTDHTQGYYRSMKFDKNLRLYAGNLTVDALAGSGNAYDCLDSTGKHYRGSPTC